MELISLAVLGVLAVLAAAVDQSTRGEVPVFSDPTVQGVQEHLNQLCTAHDRRLAEIRTPAELSAELNRAGSRYRELLALDLETARTAPQSLLVETLDLPEYRIEKRVLQSAPGVPVPCTIYVPRGGPVRKPALVSPHGHSGRDRPLYQNAYQRFAKAGFVVLARDGWGKQERRGTGHGAEGGQLILTGASLLGLEIWDNLRCVDYLTSRPDVDPDRLGMTGVSGGGTQTLFTLPLEPRLRAGSPTCAVTSFRADLADTTMCICELLPDLLTVGDHGLFLALAYPRPVLVVNGKKDSIFPVAGARASVRQARALYAAGGHAQQLEFAEFDAPHTWDDAMLARQIRWFRAQFGLSTVEELPGGDAPLPPERLRCWPGADLPADAVTLSGLNRARMNAALPARTRAAGRTLELDAERQRARIRSRWSGSPAPPRISEMGEGDADGMSLYQRDSLGWPSAVGGPVAVRVSRPLAAPDQSAQHVVVRLERDRLVPQLDQLYWDERIRTRCTVLEPAYTGRGLAPAVEAQVAAALLVSGRSLLAERVRDLLTALEAARAQYLLLPDSSLTLVGRGFDGILLLHAAPFLPESTRLVLDHTPITYLQGAELDFTTPELTAPPAHWTLLPGFARDHDLSELLEVAAPRRVLLLHPQDSAQNVLSTVDAAALLARLDRTDRSHLEVLAREAPRGTCLRRLAEFVEA